MSFHQSKGPCFEETSRFTVQRDFKDSCTLNFFSLPTFRLSSITIRIQELQQCQTNVLSRSKAFVLLLLFQKRSNIFVLETKFCIETKRFLSVLEKFGPKAFVLVDFQIFFWNKKKFCFVLKKPQRNLKHFGFVLIQFFDNTKVLF